jgi:hypothetical protein
MSSRVVVFASVLALAAGGILGCGPTAGTAPTTRSTVPERDVTRPTEKRRDVEVRTPGADVDVRRDADGRLKVDVRAKDRATNR